MGFDINKPYRMRDGRAAQAIVGPDGYLYGWRSGACDEPTTFSGYPSGAANMGREDDYDLVNIPERRTVKVWINVYDSASSVRSGSWYLSRAEADLFANSDRIACIEREISYDLGEGL